MTASVHDVRAYTERLKKIQAVSLLLERASTYAHIADDILPGIVGCAAPSPGSSERLMFAPVIDTLEVVSPRQDC